MNTLIGLALVVASFSIVWLLDRMLSRPTFRELTRFPGNETAAEQYLYRRNRMSKQLFLPFDVRESKLKEDTE